MYIKVKVKASAKHEEILKKKEDHFEISVKEKAERNMANTRVREIIADEYGVLVKAVRIISGHTSPTKILSIHKE